MVESARKHGPSAELSDLVGARRSLGAVQYDPDLEAISTSSSS
jgi:hypothetical protein